MTADNLLGIRTHASMLYESAASIVKIEQKQQDYRCQIDLTPGAMQRSRTASGMLLFI